MPISVSKDAVGSFGSVEPGKSFFLDDVFESDDKAKPISGGIFIYNKSPEDFEYTYKYDEFKVVLEGEFTLKDKATGETTHAKAEELKRFFQGDVVKIPKGTTVLFNSPSTAKAFYVGQRAFRDF